MHVQITESRSIVRRIMSGGPPLTPTEIAILYGTIIYLSDDWMDRQPQTASVETATFRR